MRNTFLIATTPLGRKSVVLEGRYDPSNTTICIFGDHEYRDRRSRQHIKKHITDSGLQYIP